MIDTDTDDTTEDAVEEAAQTGQRDVDEMDERLERLDGHIDEAKTSAQAVADEGGPAEEVAGDYEDVAPDEPIGDDATGFDDPEAEDADEDEF
jgi:hypothetical protein